VTLESTLYLTRDKLQVNTEIEDLRQQLAAAQVAFLLVGILHESNVLVFARNASVLHATPRRVVLPLHPGDHV
jgi:hypothetical protein